MDNTRNVLGAALAVTVVNFGCLGFFEHNWHVAFERSYFQWIALLMVWINM